MQTTSSTGRFLARLLNGWYAAGDADLAPPRLARWDILIIAALVLAAAAASFAASHLTRPETADVSNVWFDSDMPRVVKAMTDRSASHERTRQHPLFLLMGYVPVRVLSGVCGVSRAVAMRLVIAGVAGAWAAVLYALLRAMRLARGDALLFTVLAALSAGSVFWFSVVETYSFGSLTILIALLIVARSQHRDPGLWGYTLAGALTLSVTVTNWMTGLLMAFLRLPWRKALQVCVNAFCIVVAAWTIQKNFFPSAEFFTTAYRAEGRFVRKTSPREASRAFLVHAMVMPEIQETPRPDESGRYMTTVQTAKAGSASRVGVAAVVLWLALLAAGLAAALTKGGGAFRTVLLLTLAGHFLLHMVYGKETFLYALHYVPLLVVTAACAARTRLRPIVLTVAAALIVCLAINNGHQFRRAVDFVERDLQLRAHAVPQ